MIDTPNGTLYCPFCPSQIRRGNLGATGVQVSNDLMSLLDSAAPRFERSVDSNGGVEAVRTVIAMPEIGDRQFVELRIQLAE